LSSDEIVLKYTGCNYKIFKEDLVGVVTSVLKPFQERFYTIINSSELDEMLDNGRKIAGEYAFKKVEKCKYKLGLSRKR
ncbi:MAG TPA: hypothetical protein P5042_06620, partial [Candidatus Izemoplasmatales bacterium]|nr:hypothetical protein [Candidatus Izemoplasmatales bacterium]